MRSSWCSEAPDRYINTHQWLSRGSKQIDEQCSIEKLFTTRGWNQWIPYTSSAYQKQIIDILGSFYVLDGNVYGWAMWRIHFLMSNIFRVDYNFSDESYRIWHIRSLFMRRYTGLWMSQLLGCDGNYTLNGGRILSGYQHHSTFDSVISIKQDIDTTCSAYIWQIQMHKLP